MNHAKIKILIVLALLFFSAAGAKAGMLDVSDDKEVRMGQDAAEEVIRTFGLWDSDAETARVKGITDALVKACGRPELEYHFYILNSDMINAFALPGGFIFITRGLMDFVDDDDELASVIGHELVHVAHRHGVTAYKKSVKDMITNFLLLILTKDPNVVIAGQMYQQSRSDLYGRGAEVDADSYGLRYMIDAGYDPDAFVRFFSKMERYEQNSPNLLEDYYEAHPPMKERKQLISDEFKKLGIPEYVDTANNVNERVIAQEICGNPDESCTGTLNGGKKKIMLLGDAGDEINVYTRAIKVSENLNSLLDKGVRLYEFTKRKSNDKWSLAARNTTIVEVLPGDLSANNNAPGDESALLDAWLGNLKMFIWSDFLKDE